MPRRKQMPRRKWTVLLLSEDGNNRLQRALHLRTLRLGAIVGGLFCVALPGILGAAGFVGGQAFRGAYLEHKNTLLTEELVGIRGQVQELEAGFRSLTERDRELRILAGLDEIDEEVLQVGVGGPGGPTLEESALYSVDEAAAEEIFAVSYDLSALQRRSRLLRASLVEALDSLSAHRALLESIPSILPTNGRLSSRFSSARLHPIHNRELPHEGIDIVAPRGTPILAAANGRVTRAGRRAGGYGLVVELDHGHGYSTLYGHASQVLVRPGQRVQRGEVIAQVGTSGITTSPHLHYEVRVGDRPVNPLNYVISRAIP